MKRKVFYTFYIFSIMLGLFALFVLMFFRDEKIDADVEENGIEYDYAEELEQYVSRNFSFRTQAISMFTSLREMFLQALRLMMSLLEITVIYIIRILQLIIVA